MTSRSERRSQSPDSTPAAEPLRRRSEANLRSLPREFLATAELTVGPRTRDEDTVCLYWALQALVPVSTTVEGASVTASFRRFGPSAEVVAWMLVDELAPMPNATLRRAEVQSCDGEAGDSVALAAPDYKEAGA